MKFTCLLLCAILAQLSLYSQNLTGSVVSDNNETLINAYIYNQNTGNHTHTNINGLFSLSNTSVGDTISVTHLGFDKYITVVNSLESPLNIVMIQKAVSLNQVVIEQNLDALNRINDVDVKTNPVNSSQEILRKVPGLFIGQHAGGGKAEQIFLRGFDVDHGTDVAITVDGMPVNMVSHAHGQGYADLHFIIPETVDKVEFGKGSYYADKGNFNTAGYVNFKTKQKLKNSLLKIEAGQFNSQRFLGMLDVVSNKNHNAYFAGEYTTTDGPFESPQNFNRINALGKYTLKVGENEEVGITLSHFTSRWDASGQVPQRAVESGLITRFGAIDDTEGGQTSRSNININHQKILNENTSINTNVFYSNYNFELFSNFTFFLEDSINSDQIKQKENRSLYGLNTEYFKIFNGYKVNGNYQIGLSLRADESNNNELSKTLNRSEILSRTQLGNIFETNTAAYVNANFYLGKWQINPALRIDHFNFNYNDALLLEYETQAEANLIVSPKLNFIFSQSPKLQYYLKMGKGFHSNDTRVVVAQNGKKTLPASYGADLGFIWKPKSNMVVNVAYWKLYLEQEFVYVGDAGIVEPSGETERQGVDLSVRYQPLKWLFWNVDANYTHAIALKEKKGENYIPLAPPFTLVSGLSVVCEKGIYGGVNARYMMDRPANETNTIVAEGYTVIDANVGYNFKRLSLGVQIQNLLDTEWNETQFATESRIKNEATSVEEIHFTPGTPFFAKGVIEFRF